jgi:hypothetical protein
MKKVMKSFMAMALGLSLVLSGCSKDDDDNNLSAFTGTYPVEVNVLLAGESVISSMPVNLILSEEGGNFKASASLSTYGDINIVLSSLNANLPDLIEGSEVTGISGYLFKVEEQTINIAGMDAVKIKGETLDGMNGYHGIVAKGTLGGTTVKLIAMFLKGVDLPVTIIIAESEDE